MFGLGTMQSFCQVGWDLSIHELRELIVRDSDIAFAPTAATSVLGRMTTALWVKGGGPVQWVCGQ